MRRHLPIYLIIDVDQACSIMSPHATIAQSWSEGRIIFHCLFYRYMHVTNKHSLDLLNSAAMLMVLKYLDRLGL